MRFGPFRLDINLQIERFAASVGHSNFIDTLWNHFRVAVRISSFLDTFSRCRLSFVSSTVYFDSVETSLGVTEYHTRPPMFSCLELALYFHAQYSRRGGCGDISGLAYLFTHLFLQWMFYSGHFLVPSVV